MKTIIVPAKEGWDENTEEFVDIPERKLIIEHSLISISKWESKYKVPFYQRRAHMEPVEFLDYIRCMTINNNVNSDIYFYLTEDNFKEIEDYMDDSMTATKLYDWNKTKGKRQEVTSERIYMWMIKLHIPIEFEKWHINRLLTLIELCSDDEPHELTATEIMEINKARRLKNHTKG